jgi:hypothetical protein
MVLLSTFLTACRAPGHVKAGEPSQISIGMTKDEVIKHLGKPEHVTADAQAETLNYVLERPWWQDRPFRVKLVEGKVISFDVE